MSKSQDRILSKLNKLLAMSNSTANEHEAMTATRQLHALLAKHNISLEQLNEEPESIGEARGEQRCQPWKRIIAKGVANLYFCDFYIISLGGRKSAYVFVGSEVNRTFALHIFSMIIKTIVSQSRRDSKKTYGEVVSGFTRSFWAGASNRIAERCKELIDSAKEGTLEDEEGNTLPALLSTYEQNSLQVKSWMDINLNLKSMVSRTRSTNSAGSKAGREAGDRAQLSRSLQGNNSPKLLNN